MIKAIIFDMDGTLVDSMPIHIEIWKELAQKYSIDFSRDLIDELNGKNTPDIAGELVERFSLDIDPVKLAEEKRSLSHKLIVDGVALYEGALDTLILLKRLGYRLGIATSTPRDHAELTLGAQFHDLELDAIVTDSEIENSKPAPDIFLRCAEEICVSPSECIVVEDSINGIMGAKKAGMKAVAITNTTPREKFTMADWIIDNIKEINSELIEKLN